MRRRTILRWLLALAALALVAWVRVLPLGLPEADHRANDFMRRRVEEHLASQTSPSRAVSETDVDAWIDHQPDSFEAERAALAAEIRSLLQYPGEDGRQHVYLGGLDGYHWLRMARNYLRTETTCDAVVGSTCRDTLANAPVGTEMRYGHSLHIAAIVAAHRLLGSLIEGYPLPASAFWVPVAIGVLGVLPAFWLGCRLAGAAGGVVAALMVSLQPTLLARSIGGDNDIWNAVLPLSMMWAAVEARLSRSWARRIGFSAAAGVFAGLHAATWAGWLFAFVLLVAGLGMIAVVHALRSLLRRNRGEEAGEVVRAVLEASILLLATVATVALVGSVEPIGEMMGRLAGLIPLGDTSNGGSLWPSGLDLVAELEQLGPGAALAAMGHTLYFVPAAAGVVLAILPRHGWAWTHWISLGTALAAALLPLAGGDSPVRVIGALLALAVLLAVAAYVLVETGPSRAAVGPGILLAIWLLLAFRLSAGGARYLLLLGPPYGLAVALGAGRAVEWLERRSEEREPSQRLAGRVAACLLVAVLLTPAVRQGHALASGHLPRMNDVWWETLERIREESPPDAIVHAWWDHGYWIKYVSERRVSADGGTLQTHVIPWLSRALLSPSARESAGILRLLSCGSAATPMPEGEFSAYARTLEITGDELVAYEIVRTLVRIDAVEARSYLLGKGIDTAAVDSILAASHCVPAPSFLLTSTEELDVPDGWLSRGLFDLREEYVFRALEERGAESVRGELVERRGYAEGDADDLIRRARVRRDPLAIRPLIAPYRRNSEWLPCTRPDSHTVLCPIGLISPGEGSLVEGFLYDPARPGEGRLVYRNAAEPPSVRARRGGSPAVVVVAGAAREEAFPRNPAFPDLGVLVDARNDRILIGAPEIVRSTLVELLYLDGRYAPHFVKVDERTADLRVVTWRVNWDARGNSG